jgi:DNA-binding transcriptional LysR family regulator
MRLMDAADLRVFEAVARLGGMNRAAAELNTVQSNVTARIRLLEDELKTPLFERSSRGVVLTAAGRRLLPYAVQVRHLLDDARRAVEDDGAPTGSLTLGSLETTTALRLSPVLSAYLAKYPEVDLVLKTGTTAELIDEVLEHRVDGAFVCGPVDHRELEAEIVFREELAILTAPTVGSLDALFETGDRRLLLPPATGGHSGEARCRRHTPARVRNARSRLRLRRRRDRRDPAAEGPDRSGLARRSSRRPRAACVRGHRRHHLHPPARRLRVQRAHHLSAIRQTAESLSLNQIALIT